MWDVDKIPTGPGLVKRHGRLDVNTDSPTFEETVAAHAPKAHAASHTDGGSDEITVTQAQVTNLTTDLAAKAPLASPTFTGTPAAPTAAPGTNTTQVATTAFVKGAVDALVASAPGALDTLDELAAALGDDANFAGTVTTALAGKAPLASPTFTGQVAVPLGSAAAPSITPTGDTNTGIYSPGADQVGIATAGTAAVTVDASQRVGIGTTSPAQPLDIYHATGANVIVSGDLGVNVIYYRSSTDVNGPVHSLRKARGTTASRSIVSSGDVLGSIDFRGYDGAAFIAAAQIRASVDAAPGTNDMPGNLTFWTTADGTASMTERMRIDNAGLITGTGTSLGAWTAYTPTLGGFTPGSGTPTSGAWVRIGKIVHFRAIWTYGAGSAAASARPTLTLPSASQAVLAGNFTAYFFDTSAGAYYQAVPIQTSTTVVTMGVLGTNGVSNAASTTSPFTWATGDTITLSGTYELA